MINLMFKTQITKLTDNSVTLFNLTFVFITGINSIATEFIRNYTEKEFIKEKVEMFQTLYVVVKYILLFFCIKTCLIIQFPVTTYIS